MLPVQPDKLETLDDLLAQALEDAEEDSGPTYEEQALQWAVTYPEIAQVYATLALTQAIRAQHLHASVSCYVN